MTFALYKLKNKILIFNIIAILTTCSAICYSVYLYYPTFLTTSYDRCCTYFNLDNVPLVLVDDLYSQGEDVFAFGEKVYFLGGLNDSDLTSLHRNMIENGAVEATNNICLIKKRHNVIGVFKLYMNNSPYQVIVSYKKLKSR